MVTPVFLERETKRMWLQSICNKYGDFKVATSYKKKDGDIGFSKHKSVIDCWSNDLCFLDKVMHRQVLPYEIILDLDDQEAIKNVNSICDHLDELGEDYYCFFTGSKGYHIHIVSKKIALYPDWLKMEIRKQVYALSSIRFDEHKASSKVLIAMENTPHWKTGNKKELVRCSRWLY